MKDTQVHMAVVEEGIEVSIRRGRAAGTQVFPSWGEALSAVNFATAWNGAPDPTTDPAGGGTPEVELEAKAA
jgi:hypothetical protein